MPYAYRLHVEHLECTTCRLSEAFESLGIRVSFCIHQGDWIWVNWKKLKVYNCNLVRISKTVDLFEMANFI